MRELPILFSGAMVRALLDGSKTQTRRIVKLPHNNPLGQWEPTVIGGENGGKTASGETAPLQGSIWHTRTGECLICPHGQPSDRLYVRETWSGDFANHYPFERVWYAADNDRRHEIHVSEGVRGIYSPEGNEHVPFRWRPSIHMPRAVSRITLEVTSVRVERLQDISEADAKSEGSRECDPVSGKEVILAGSSQRGSYVLHFRDIWESTKPPAGAAWADNPWVWVVEFKRVEK